MKHIKSALELEFYHGMESPLSMEDMGTNLDIAMHNRYKKDLCSAFLYIIGQNGREIFNTLH
jgi:hypothetical protein